MNKNVAARHLQNNAYANATDFCAIFAANMESLYALALLLTGNQEEAEACFTQALEDCMSGNQVFKPWAESWSRLSVIERGLRMKSPRVVQAATALAFSEVSPTALPSELAAVLHLDAFRRFVYVLTVLEKYSVRDAAILMKHPKRAIEAARLQAIEILGRAAIRANEPVAPSLSTALSA